MTHRTRRSNTRRRAALVIAGAVTLAMAACTSPTPSTATVPGAPDAPMVGPCSGGLQAISWNPPASDGGSPITDYEVSRDGSAFVGSGLNNQLAFACGGNGSLYSVVACNVVGCGAPSPAVGYVPATPLAGNGVVEPPEECDDGNTANGDGCSSTATIEPGYACTGSPSVCVPTTGVRRSVFGPPI